MKKPAKKQSRIRPIHKRIVLHTSSLLLLLGGGFIPLPIQGFGQAYDINVSAKVAAPIPTDPAVITNPHDGDHTTDPTITISGSCPADTYVTVYVGDRVAGTSICNGGEFSVQVTLSPGANIIKAQVYNKPDDAGPSSSAITVYYDVPAAHTPQPGQSGSAPTPAAGGGGLTLDIPYAFTAKNTHDVWEWNITIGGGVLPYTLTINWGDGVIERITRDDSSPFTRSHAYDRQGTYQPLFSVRDSANNGASVQLAAEVRERPTPLVQLLNSVFGEINPGLVGAAYVIIFGFIGVFWAFEIRHFKRYLDRKRRLRHRHV